MQTKASDTEVDLIEVLTGVAIKRAPIPSAPLHPSCSLTPTILRFILAIDALRPQQYPTTTNKNNAHSLAQHFSLDFYKFMETTTTSSASSPSPLSTGGTTASQTRMVSPGSDRSSNATRHLENQQEQPKDSYQSTINERDTATQRLHQINALSSPLSSPSAVSYTSSPCFTRTPLRSLAEDCDDFDPDPIKVSVQQEQPILQQRSRMLSAPLPSVPPPTPSSVGYRGCRPQSYNHNALPSPSSALLGSPTFIRSRTATSPLVRHRSESEQSLDSEASDAPSVEIISADIEDSFVTGRFESRDGSVVTRGIAYRQAPLRPSAPAGNNQDIVSATIAASSSYTPIQVSVLQTIAPAMSPRGCTQPVRHSPTSSHVSHAHVSLQTSSSDARDFEFSTASESPLSHTILSTTSFTDRGDRIDASPPQSSNSLRTPNVYINGLPPHFPDESLYAMTQDFGKVLSVRTFTRCVGEKMSGYGFVLFESIDSAERCIEALRKYRNLHPSFSKQVHKIPGTPYATGAITIPPSGSLTSMTSQNSVPSLASFPSVPSLSSASTLSSTALSINQSLNLYENPHSHRTTSSLSGASSSSASDLGGRDLSFREKMERLKDDRSTNLYMEGLPLSIDDVSLAALVSPYRIVSRRFFQTKLSNPPRMIAFVRLESRQAAEEVVERLHGRVVRGWNDNGCRISVRFADTNEQRELRRSERLARGEDEDVGGAGRLSMAHAALLNLRGAEAHAHLSSRSTQPAQNKIDPIALSGQNNLPLHPNDMDSQTSSAVTSNPLLNGFGQLNLGVSQGLVSPAGTLLSRSMLPPLVRSDPLDALDISTLRTSSAAISNALALKATLSPIAHTALHSVNNQPSLSAQALEASRLALLQQEAQLKQLQLLQQMQSLREQDIRGLNAITGAETHPLMPSAKIRPTRVGEHFGGEAGLPSAQHYSQASNSKSCSFDKAPLSAEGSDSQLEGKVVSSMGLTQASRDRQHSSSQLYESIFNSPRRVLSRVQPSLDQRSPGKHVNISDHNEEASSISPALTFTSRTPSTMSPATPFFGSFNTPASAPATFPKRKSGIHDQEYRRTPNNEIQP